MYLIINLRVMKNVSVLTFLSFLLIGLAPLQAQLPYFRDFGPSNGCDLGSNSYFYEGGIGNTSFDAMYTEECYFMKTQTVKLQEPLVPGQTYTMYLHFSEIYYGQSNPIWTMGDGARIFHVDVEGVRVLSFFDIHANVGSRTAIVFKHDFVAGSDGYVDLTFTPIVNNAKISAVEIVEQGEASIYPPAGAIIDLDNSSFPVEWAEIDAEARGNQAIIRWATAWESNNDEFEIQMGNLGGSFETIGKVDGAGTTTEATSYQFYTTDLNPGAYVFRIKQRDFDGRISLSPMVEVTIGTGGTIHMAPLQPNPASEYTLIRFYGHKGDQVNLTISTLQGQVVAEVFAGKLAADGQQSFPVSTELLSPGYYFVQLVQESQVTAQRLLVSPK